MWSRFFAKLLGQFEPPTISPDDPLAAAHAAIATWTQEAAEWRHERHSYRSVELKNLPSGQKLLEALPAEAIQYIHAAIAQIIHWDKQLNCRSGPSAHPDRWSAEWNKTYANRQHALLVVTSLMRRSLPFQKSDLLHLMAWCTSPASLSRQSGPISQTVRALERYAAETQLDDELREAVGQFVEQLGRSSDRDAKRLAVAAKQLCGQHEPVELDEPPAAAVRPAAKPAPAGSFNVLDQLKRHLGMFPREPLPVTTMLELDRFPLRNDSPLWVEHQTLTTFFEQVAAEDYRGLRAEELEAGLKVSAMEPHARGYLLLALAERHVNQEFGQPRNESYFWQSRYASAAILLFNTRLSLSRDGLFDFLLFLSVAHYVVHNDTQSRVEEFVSQAGGWASAAPLTEGERYVLSLVRDSLIGGAVIGSPPKVVLRLTELIGDGAEHYLIPGELWSNAVNDDVGSSSRLARRQWTALFTHLLAANGARPTAKWLKTASALVQALGADVVCQALARWLPLVSAGRSTSRPGPYLFKADSASYVMMEENATCLRGLLWLIPTLADGAALTRDVTAVAISAYKKVPGVGPRAIKVGNAAIYVLSELATTDAVGQLALLKVRVKFGSAQKEIEKAFNAAAEALELPRDQIEEMSVPSYGLEEVGMRRESLGDYRAELVVDGSGAELKWSDAHGKTLKSVPTKVKNEHGEDLKDLRQSLKDIQAMLPAQRDRLDSMFLVQRSWPLDVWRQRYLDHPLVGTIARRLIWCVDGEGAFFVDGQATDVQGNTLAHGKTAEITPWHPVGRAIDEITSWRRRLEELNVTQPFKQAHREVYLLTDAERATRTYSNRFAAHILRQHQFNALCGARGWKNKLRLLVDDVYPPAHKDLPQYDLRAEFWIEGIGEEYGADTNDAGVFLRVATDQVRFYRHDAAENSAHAGGGGYATRAAGPGRDDVNDPLPLEQVPPLVLSEIMRDVDLFVGVASLGNDPAWADGGPEARYRDYWHGFSFGALSGTANTRKQVLERLIPRLKIAEQCSFSDRFLVVQGKKRSYKIHLGSGNILMEPNDQYLCIVPDGRSRAQQEDLYLPFEGDGTLSIIISKALFLAEDHKIKDPTIVRQIDNH